MMKISGMSARGHERTLDIFLNIQHAYAQGVTGRVGRETNTPIRGAIWYAPSTQAQRDIAETLSAP